jgi:hypothetical protein
MGHTRPAAACREAGGRSADAPRTSTSARLRPLTRLRAGAARRVRTCSQVRAER